MNKETLQDLIAILKFMETNDEFTIKELQRETEITEHKLYVWMKFFHQSRYIKRGNYKFGINNRKERLWVIDNYPLKRFT